MWRAPVSYRLSSSYPTIIAHKNGKNSDKYRRFAVFLMPSGFSPIYVLLQVYHVIAIGRRDLVAKRVEHV